MEAYKKNNRKSPQMIDHIKFISHDLFKEQSIKIEFRYKFHNIKRKTPIYQHLNRSLKIENIRKKSTGLQYTLPNQSSAAKRQQTSSTSREIDQNFRNRGKSQNVQNNHEQYNWDNFLKRQQEWNRQKKNSLRLKQLQEMARQNPEIRNRIKTQNDKNNTHNQTESSVGLNQIEKTIDLIRKDTEQLRLRLLKINEQKKSINRGYFSKVI